MSDAFLIQELHRFIFVLLLFSHTHELHGSWREANIHNHCLFYSILQETIIRPKSSALTCKPIWRMYIFYNASSWLDQPHGRGSLLRQIPSSSSRVSVSVTSQKPLFTVTLPRQISAVNLHKSNQGKTCRYYDIKWCFLLLAGVPPLLSLHMNPVISATQTNRALQASTRWVTGRESGGRHGSWLSALSEQR